MSAGVIWPTMAPHALLFMSAEFLFLNDRIV